MSMRPERDTRREKPKKEFDELLLEVRRVTRVTTGGRRLSFRARGKSDLVFLKEMMWLALFKKLLMKLTRIFLKCH